jgi:predicted regulator of Ras-like GTPase activity (Roadblock/LC7/MglB family)
MDAASALALLTEISSQIRAAVLYDDVGSVLGSTFEDGERGQRLAAAAADLLAAAQEASPGTATLTQLEAATDGGSVFVVGDGERRIAAVTGPEPTVGLVFYDLKTCLRDAGDAPKPRRSRRSRTTEGEEDDGAA